MNETTMPDANHGLPVPRRFAVRSGDWNRVGSLLAARLSDALSLRVEAGPARFAMRSAARIRARKDAMVVPVTDGFVTLSRTDAARLSVQGLGSDVEEGFRLALAAGLAREACGCVRLVFGGTVSPTGTPRDGWPATARDAAPFLCVSLPLRLRGEAVTLRLLLDGPPRPYGALGEDRRPAARDVGAEGAADLFASFAVRTPSADAPAVGTVLPLARHGESDEVWAALPGGRLWLPPGRLERARDGRILLRLAG